MSRKCEVQRRRGASSSPEAEPLRSVAPIADTTATNEDRDAAINESPPEIAVQFKTLRRRMWVGVVCMVIITVALIKLLP